MLLLLVALVTITCNSGNWQGELAAEGC